MGFPELEPELEPEPEPFARVGITVIMVDGIAVCDVVAIMIVMEWASCCSCCIFGCREAQVGGCGGSLSKRGDETIMLLLAILSPQ